MDSKLSEQIGALSSDMTATTTPDDSTSSMTITATPDDSTSLIMSTEPVITLMPDQSYIGVWRTENQPPEEMKIYEISADTVKFETGLFRQFGFTATAIEQEGTIVFEDEETKIKGRLEFGENSIIVTYDSFGSFADRNIGSNVYRFTVKSAGE